MADVILACTQCAMVDYERPDTNFHGAASYELGATDYSYQPYLLLQFEQFPSLYKYRGLSFANLDAVADRTLPNWNKTMTWQPLESTFDEATVTFNTKPFSGKLYAGKGIVDQGTGQDDVTFSAYYATATHAEDAKTALQQPAFMIGWKSIESGESIKFYTNAAASALRPVFRVPVTESVPIRVIGTAPEAANTIWANAENTFTWDFEVYSGFTILADEIVQTSAVFEWQEYGASSWNSIQVSGSAKTITIPAGTFSAGTRIIWKVTSTLDTGETVRTSAGGTLNFVLTRVGLQPVGIAGITNEKPDTTLPWSETRENRLENVVFTSLPQRITDWLFSFRQIPAQFQYIGIERAYIAMRGSALPGAIAGGDVFELSSIFSHDAVTWNNQPARGANYGSFAVNAVEESSQAIQDMKAPGVYQVDGKITTETSGISKASALMLRAQALAMHKPPSSIYGNQYFMNLRSPVEMVVLLNGEQITSRPEAVTNRAGYINPHAAQTFTWEHVPDGDYWCVATWRTVSAMLYWSSDGGSTWASVAAPANSQNVILPAETLPTGTIQWYVTATDDQGTTSTSPTYTITTEDSETTATPIAPINTVEDGSAPIRFIWETANNHGTAQTAADLQKSTDGSTWETLGTVTGSENSFTAQADTFLNGNVYWRVRAYNADGTAGPWSEAATFKAVNAPPAPVVSASEVPFSAVTWQSEGQEAWRITVDGTVYGPYFGGSKRFEIPTYLENGGHTITVEAQGASGKWSKPGQVIVQIQNVPGDPVTLSGSFERDAELSWETASQTADFLIYRDGVRIGHTSGMEFADRTVLGGHSWQVINRLPSGNYTASNIVQGVLSTEELSIALLSGGGWLELTKSRNPTRQETYSLSQNVSLTHFAGQEYPEAEASPYKTLQGNFDVSWNRDELEQAAAFEAMIGKPIIYKAPSGETLVGILAAIQKNPINFFKAYTATVQRINWRDFVDEDN